MPTYTYSDLQNMSIDDLQAAYDRYFNKADPDCVKIKEHLDYAIAGKGVSERNFAKFQNGPRTGLETAPPPPNP